MAGRRPKTFVIRPSAAINAAYRKRLDLAITEMAASVSFWITTVYGANRAEIVTTDAPARDLAAEMHKLGDQWQARFDQLAPELARYFATAVALRTDTALAAALRKGGMSVRLQLTPRQADALEAIVSENVALIRSISSEYLTQVQGMVMRSVQTGRDLGYMTRELRQRYGITTRRAKTIALSQNNMATSSLVKIRQDELGLEAVWLHSAGGKVPRPEHVAFSGKKYDPKKGAFLEGKWTWPGVEINCRCVSKTVLPGSVG